MLTPSFELQQSKDFLTVIIKAPFAKVAETEIFIEENGFKFYSKPYFLRLTLPGNIVEDGREKADYDVDKGIFTVTVPKETPGEHFEGLDMITKLLAPKKKSKEATSLIEVVGDGVEVEDGGDDDFDWCIEQEPYVEKPGLLEAPKYGFAYQKSGVFERLQEDMVYIVDCPDPDKQNVLERRELRLQTEWEKFDEDHYISDLFEDDSVKQLLQFTPQFYEGLQLVMNGSSSIDEVVEFTDEEQDVLRKLPRKEYILDGTEENSVYLGLLDIIYAYAYNYRSTEGENHCESGWTICKISATLSWLEVFTSIHDVIHSCFRRSLCYPLYRHWGLNEKVLKDVTHIFYLGRRCLLKVLLEIRSILMDQENRYVLNDLYVTDYCVWIQSASSKKLQSLAESLSKVKITKDEIGFNLPDIEQLAQSAIMTDNGDDLDSLGKKLKDTNIDDTNEDSESSDNDSDSGTECTTTDSDDIVSSEDEENVVRGASVKQMENDSDKSKVESNKLIEIIDSKTNVIESEDIVANEERLRDGENEYTKLHDDLSDKVGQIDLS